jgi:hypothetical protein
MTRQVFNRLGVTDSDQAWERHGDLGWMIKGDATFRHKSPFGEFDTEIRTDALGMRVPLDPVHERGRAARNILLIGDSVTAGYEVPYEQTFAALVEATLNGAGDGGTRVLNAAVRGYSTEQAYKRMLALLARSELGITDVVYQFSQNDPFENMSLHFPKRLMSKPGAYLDAAGSLKFRSLDVAVGVLDAEAHFVEAGGNVGVLPVIGRTVPTPWGLTRALVHAEPQAWFDQLYTVGLIKLAAEIYAASDEDIEIVRARYPYINANYIADSHGGYSPGFIDVSWEPGSYPLRLLEEIIRSMKAESERHGVRFYLSIPLRATPPMAKTLGEIAAKYRIALIDPVSDGSRDRLEAQCGGTFVFKLDGHYSECGHRAQAEPIVAALRPQSLQAP